MSTIEVQTPMRSMPDERAGTEERGAASLLVRVAGVLLGVWLVLAGVAAALPSLRPGAAQIYADKKALIASGSVFAAAPETRVAISGNSRVLAGFKPALFDQLAGGRVQSYNLGLPNTIEFVDSITRLVERGQAPTHLLLTLGWGNTPPPTLREHLRDDDWLMGRIFPFRSLLRDVTLFLVRSQRHGGPARYYEHVKSSLAGARDDRGYYFISGQSHYPGHRLPDDFALPVDTPDLRYLRAAEPSGPQFERLMALSEESGMQIILVPTAFREGQYAPAATRSAEEMGLGGTGVRVAGPDYWLFPPAFFSDPIHMNPDGAEVYTRRLWALLSPGLEPTTLARSGAE